MTRIERIKIDPFIIHPIRVIRVQKKDHYAD